MCLALVSLSLFRRGNGGATGGNSGGSQGQRKYTGAFIASYGSSFWGWELGRAFTPG